MRYRLLIYLFLFLSIPAFSQNKVKLDDITNKVIPEEIEEEVIDALSYYPDLADTKIHFVFKDNIKNAFMVAQPKWYGIFQGKKKRAYTIKMERTFKLKDKEIPIEDLPSEIVKGWIAHELGHIMDYKQRSGISMVGFGIGYVTSIKFLMNAERAADVFAINHGLGNLLISTKHFILDHEEIPVNYKKRIKRYYLSPEVVVQLIEEYDEVGLEDDDSEI